MELKLWLEIWMKRTCVESPMGVSWLEVVSQKWRSIEGGEGLVLEVYTFLKPFELKRGVDV